jgi:hypothetical protein
MVMSVVQELENSRLEELRRMVRDSHCTATQLSHALSQLFRVKPTEVGLLIRHEYFLRFLYPVELQAAGSLPLSGISIAARTATNRKADLFNNFVRIPHRSIFETIKLRDGETPLPIQKLMSAPVFGSNGDVVGVVQVSRKGETPRAAGVDFSRIDLQILLEAAEVISPYVTKFYRPQPALSESAKPRSERGSGVGVASEAAS